MKLSHRFSKYASRLALAGSVAAALVLAGCGGGGSDAPATVTPPVVDAPVVTGSATGVLTDAAVGGVSYKTSSGVTGTTSATGAYSYNPGDTVEFKLGALSLGTVTATGIVTPMELSGGSAAKLQNLLVLLQSLDTDGNPANGITVAAASAAAVSSSVNLGGATNTFAADAGVQAAMTAGGVAGAPKTTTAANAHFKAQGLELLSRNIWVSQSFTDGSRTVVLDIKPTGKYMHIEAGPSDMEGQTVIASSGPEFGTLTVLSFSPQGFAVTSTVAFDRNGEWGASNLRACDRFRNVGDKLIVGDDCEGNHGNGVFSKMDNDPTSLVGAWSGTQGATTFKIYFFANGRLLISQSFETDGVPSEGNAFGGRYTVSGSTLTLSYDDGEAESSAFTLSADGQTMGLAGLEAFSFTRISK